MPLPWDPAGAQRARIPDVAKRAITIKQLRDLRTLLQRLTKTGLLRNTTAFSAAAGDFGRPITWHTIDSYHVANEVIKKVIPFIDPEGERDPKDPERRWYSWVEFVSGQPQPAKVMFSHWWGGRFKDFMAVVDKLALDRCLSSNTAIWVCTFANCQFGENFGATLKECPFIRALQSVELTVLLVDFRGGSLSRTWCGLEVHYATENEMELVVYTSAGRVGSSYVSGGPLVEAIKRWDIRQSEASDPPYRRQILNYVAGVEESRGLRTSGPHKLSLDMAGRPQLECEAQDPQAVSRTNGQPEYAYESALFRERGDKFEDLNMMVRLCVMSNIGKRLKPKGCIGAAPSAALRGLTLNQLRIMSKKLEAMCPWSPDSCPWLQDQDCGTLTYDCLTVPHLKQWVKHVTGAEQCSFMELVADGPQVAQYLVVHAWAHSWKDKMSALELFADAHQLPDSTVFFIDILSANLHKPWDDFVQDHRSAMAECEGVLLLSLATDVKDRMWIWHDVNKALQAGKSFFIAFKCSALACNRPFASGAWVCGDVDSDMASAFAGMDFESMQCPRSRPEDRDFILSHYVGLDNFMARFQARSRGWFAGPILQAAARSDDAACIESMCTCPGFRMNSEALKATCGETPLHIAAACGSSSALRALLSAGADPNAEDDIKERPLHYAVLAGHANTARQLLAARADPWAENAFTETPLEVARQSPTAFLAVDTREVVGLLSEIAFPAGFRRAAQDAAGSAVYAARNLATSPRDPDP